MREIKYKAWLGNVMVQVVKLDFLKRPDGIYLNTGAGYFLDGPNKGNHTDFDMNKATFLEFTGLKDKNGKEIYEGDILQLRNKENKPYHMEVLWTGQGYGYKIIRNDTKLSGYIVGHQSERGINFYNKTSEVIGNIYENPELLEESQ